MNIRYPIYEGVYRILTFLLPYRVNAMNGLSSRIIIAFCHCRCRFMDKLME